MIKKFKRFMAALSVGVIAPLFALVPMAGAVDSTVLVTPTAHHGWVLNGDPSTSTPYEFSTAAASTGVGSLYVPPIGPTAYDKFIAAKPLNIPTGDLTNVSYDFKIAGDGTADDADQFYLNVYTKLAGSDSYYDCRFDYVPASGSTTAFSTASFDATATPVHVQVKPGVTDCRATLAEMPAGSTISFVAINVGDTTTSDQGLAGYLDNVVINASGNMTAYDFELPLSPSSKDACMNGGWKTFNTPTFKNQGDCVSYAVRIKTTTTSLNSENMSGTSIGTKKNYLYQLTVSGTWANRPGESVDAECTKWQAGGIWTNAVSGGYEADLLDVQINKEFVNWGVCDETDHTYTQWVAGDGKPINLRVFDGDVVNNTQTPSWFNDNIGSLDVKVTAYPEN